jgi:hypothetical protein
MWLKRSQGPNTQSDLEASLKILLTCFLLLVAALPALAQDPPPIELGNVTFSGSIRERYEVWDWFQSPGNTQNLYGYSGTVIRFGFSQKREHFDWNIEFEAPLLLGIPDRAVRPAPQGQLGLGAAYFAANDGATNTGFIFLKQGFLRYKSGNSSFRLGRFEFTDGSEAKPKDPTLATLKQTRISQRLIGDFGFSDVLRSMDGVQYLYAGGPWTFTAVSAIPTRGVFQVDGWGWTKAPVTYVGLTRQVDFSKTSHAEWRVFGIYYNDQRFIVATDNRPAPVRTADSKNLSIGTFGGHFIFDTVTDSGTYDVVSWGALQVGSWGSLDQRSGAFAAEAGWQPKFAPRVKPWIRGGYFYSSGDGNAADGTHGTFFSVLPTPRTYARFPFFNAMNSRDAFGEFIIRPKKGLTLRSDIHGLWLSSGQDLWYSGGGAFQPWTFGFNGRPSGGNTKLANLYDISADYAWKHGLAIGLYFGYAQGGQVIKSIYPTNANGALGFTELNYRF